MAHCGGIATNSANQGGSWAEWAINCQALHRLHCCGAIGRGGSMAKVSAYIGSCSETHRTPRREPSLVAARPKKEETTVNTLINKLVAAWDRRRAYAALMQLDDRLLADIGMNRGTIAERLSRAARDTNIGYADVASILRPTAAVAANEDSVIRRAA